MADGSFNVIDSEGNDVEITVFSLKYYEDDNYDTTDGGSVTLPAEVHITDNSFGIDVGPGIISRSDFEHLATALEELDEGDDIAAFVAWVNNEGFRNVKWATADDDFKKAWRGSYENWKDYGAERLDDFKDEEFFQFVDFAAYGEWCAEGYDIVTDEDGTIHLFTE